MIALMAVGLLDNPKDEPRFIRLCEQYESYIYTICYSRLHDVGLAEDCTWMTFEQAAKIFSKFDQDIQSKNVRNLLCTIAIAKCNREWNKQARYYQLKQRLANDYEYIEFIKSPEELFWDQWNVEEIIRAIDGLSETLKVPLFLAKVHGMSIKEIAEICELTPETARKRVSLGKKKLKEILLEKAGDSND